jgi:hypothetical protein
MQGCRVEVAMLASIQSDVQSPHHIQDTNGTHQRS